MWCHSINIRANGRSSSSGKSFSKKADARVSWRRGYCWCKRSATANALVSRRFSGRPSKLSIEDQVLMTLEYWREYPTHFHIGVSWGLNESNVFRNIRKVENIFIKSGLFNVEGKKKVNELGDLAVLFRELLLLARTYSSGRCRNEADRWIRTFMYRQRQTRSINLHSL